MWKIEFLDVLAPLMVGLAGSLHCLGMCGPLVLAYSLRFKNQRGPGSTFFQAGFFHHAAFHSGRLLTYGFLGGLAAALFGYHGLDRIFLNLRSGITLVCGALMVLLGGVLLQILPLPRLIAVPSTSSARLWGRLLPPLFRSYSIGSKMVLGLATGFLPCGLSWSMILKAATYQHIGEGFLTMIFFGLGTVPLLFATGLSTSFISLKMRILGERIAAVTIMIMGLILIFKGVRVLV